MVEYRASASAGSVGTSRPSNQPVAVPAEEQEIYERYRVIHGEARKHYERTGDSSRMWQAKADQNAEIRRARRR